LRQQGKASVIYRPKTPNPAGWCLMWTMAVMKLYRLLKQHMENFLIIFKYSQGRSIPNKTKFAPGFDNHSTGGLIVVAPSIHVSDNQYQWLKGHSSFDKTLAEAPEWLLKLMEREEVLLTPFEGRSIVAGIKEEP